MRSNPEHLSIKQARELSSAIRNQISHRRELLSGLALIRQGLSNAVPELVSSSETQSILQEGISLYFLALGKLEACIIQALEAQAAQIEQASSPIVVPKLERA